MVEGLGNGEAGGNGGGDYGGAVKKGSDGGRGGGRRGGGTNGNVVEVIDKKASKIKWMERRESINSLLDERLDEMVNFFLLHLCFPNSFFIYHSVISRLHTDIFLLKKLRPTLAPLARLPKKWTLIYSLDQHGISFNTLYS